MGGEKRQPEIRLCLQASPPPCSNGLEINKPPGGSIEDLQYLLVIITYRCITRGYMYSQSLTGGKDKEMVAWEGGGGGVHCSVNVLPFTKLFLPI